MILQNVQREVVARYVAFDFRVVILVVVHVILRTMGTSFYTSVIKFVTSRYHVVIGAKVNASNVLTATLLAPN